MSIKMTDLKAQYESIKKEIDDAIAEVISDTGFILGKQVASFEDEVARYLGVRYAVGVASGTDALVLALKACGIQKGDEVITTPFTFIATAEAISRVEATVVFCDIDEKTFNLDANKLASRITKRTRAIIPVHLYGLPCEMEKIVSIAGSKDIRVIEDCAQSFGSEYNGKKTGSIGDCGTLSFFPAKTLGCFGDGGMVTTNNEKIAQALRLLRNHGSASKYIYTEHGFNSRLDTIQAAVLQVKLKYIDSWIDKRIANAQHYNKRLSLVEGLIVPSLGSNVKHTFNYYTVRIKGKRDKAAQSLKNNDIPSAVFYPLSLHLQQVYRPLGYKKGDFPVAEAMQDEVLSLPMYPELPSEQIDSITQVLKESL